MDHELVSRAVVLSPSIVPCDPGWDGCLSFEVLLVGEAAIARRRDILSSLAEAGSFRGFGVEGVPFELVDLMPPNKGKLAASCLPAFPVASEGVVERLTVRLNSPLFLGRLNRPKRSGLLPVRFIDLFQAAVRSLQALFAWHAQPLDADFEALAFAAEQVKCEREAFTEFRQGGVAHRIHDAYELRGVLGAGVYRDVPWSLIPWMHWGGRFHVGQHRVCGAGGWSLELGYDSWATATPL